MYYLILQFSKEVLQIGTSDEYPVFHSLLLKVNVKKIIQLLTKNS